MAPKWNLGSHSKEQKYFGSHEHRAHEGPKKGSSNRNFGLVFAGFFALISLFNLYKSGSYWPYSLAASSILGAIAFFASSWLTWPNRLWTKLGLLLSRIVSPIVMGALFYLVVTPIGLILRLSGKDLLSLKWQPEAESYWVKRDPPGPEGKSLRNQF